MASARAFRRTASSPDFETVTRLDLRGVTLEYRVPPVARRSGASRRRVNNGFAVGGTASNDGPEPEGEWFDDAARTPADASMAPVASLRAANPIPGKLATAPPGAVWFSAAQGSRRGR